MNATEKFAVITAAGYFGGPDTVIHSVHATIEAARKKAVKGRTIVAFGADCSYAVKGYRFPWKGGADTQERSMIRK